MDRDELKRQVEILRSHNDMNRLNVSDSIAEMVGYIEEKLQDDGLVICPDKKKNPWTENRKCDIL